MAITIRNRRIEERVRKLGEIRGEGPSAVIGRLVEKEIEAVSNESEHERVARRRGAMDEWIASLPSITDEDRRAIDTATEEMYDEDGLPR